MAVTERALWKAVEIDWLPLVLRLPPNLELTDDQLLQLCEINGELRIERNAEGELLIMPPEGSGTGHSSGKITARLGVWAEQDGTGIFFGSSAGFTLSNGAMRSPDASWILRERWEQLTRDEQRRFAPICPDFVLELRSPSDRLRDLQAKMEEYIANGARLGWLLDPERKHVYVYRPGSTVERLDDPSEVPGELVLPGFVLKAREIW